MIRMGRSSRNEQQTDDAAESYQGQTANPGSYQYKTEIPGSSNRAMSESETIARDIKEGRLSGYVGHGTVLTGETNFQAMLRVDGHLTGQVSSENGTLYIGSTGQVDANIVVSAAVINGKVNGDIIVTEKLELGRTAHVVGNIQTPRLLMEDGAILEGSCAMMKAREAEEKRQERINSHPAVEEFSSYHTSEIEEETEDDLSVYSRDEEDDEAAEATAS